MQIQGVTNKTCHNDNEISHFKKNEYTTNEKGAFEMALENRFEGISCQAWNQSGGHGETGWCVQTDDQPDWRGETIHLQ